MECWHVTNCGYQECDVEWVAEEEAEVCETITDNVRVECSRIQIPFLLSELTKMDVMCVMSKQYLHGRDALESANCVLEVSSSEYAV